MSKFTSFAALACALVLSTPALAQECCESYVVYQPSYYCCQTTLIEYDTQPMMPIYAWHAEPGIFDQAAFDGVEIVEVENELVIDNPLTYEDQLVWTGCNWQMMLVALPAAVEETFVSRETMVEESVVYQEQAFWNGNYWQTMLVAVPATQGEQIANQEDVHTVGRATYVDNTVAVEVIPEIPADGSASPSEDFNGDLATEPDTDDIKSDDDNLDDGDPKDGDSADDIDDEGDDDENNEDDDGLTDKQ